MGVGTGLANPKACGGTFFLPQDLVLWGGGERMVITRANDNILHLISLFHIIFKIEKYIL